MGKDLTLLRTETRDILHIRDLDSTKPSPSVEVKYTYSLHGHCEMPSCAGNFIGANQQWGMDLHISGTF